jgi:hypothetical protein
MVSIDNLAWTYFFHHLMACVDRTRMPQNIHNRTCSRLFCVLTLTTLWILTTLSTSNPIPKIIKNWNFDGNVTMWKLNYRKAVYFFTYHILFLQSVYIVIYYISKTLSKQTIFYINTHFCSGPYEIWSSTIIIPQGNLTSDHEIKQHIW